MKDLCCVGKRSQRTRGAVRSTWNLRQFWPHIKLTAFTVLFSKASAQLKGFHLRSEVCVSEFRTCRKSIKWEEAWIFVTNQLDGSIPPHARKRNYVLSWKRGVFECFKQMNDVVRFLLLFFFCPFLWRQCYWGTDCFCYPLIPFQLLMASAASPLPLSAFSLVLASVCGWVCSLQSCLTCPCCLCAELVGQSLLWQGLLPPLLLDGGFWPWIVTGHFF